MEIFQIASALRKSTCYPCVLATLVNIEGSSYRRPGARLLWCPSGERIGSISGGCLESDLVARAQHLLDSSTAHEIVTYDTTSENDLIWGVGTGCHGIVRVLLERLESEPVWAEQVEKTKAERRTVQLFVNWNSAEPTKLGTTVSPPPPPNSTYIFTDSISPPLRVVICGAGDDARPLTELCHSMDWQVEVIDPRPEMATAARFPAADNVRCLPVPSIATAVLWDDQTVAVIMTHHYTFDLPLLQTLGALHLPYLGLLGPKQRGDRILKDAGLDEKCDIHSPVGLDLGGDGPNAVALSIVAEIQATLYQRSAANLRTRPQSIHAD